MNWFRRAVLALPFVVAALLNVLVWRADRLHQRTEHLAGLGFLFAAPWGWLLDRGWYFGSHPSRAVDVLATYALVLWVPALLYALSLWLLMRGFGWLIACRAEHLTA